MRRRLLLTVLLVLVVVWTYQDGLADIPRGDEIAYLRERDFVAPGAEWFWHVVSFCRTRLLTGESRVLFRPLFGAVTALGLTGLPIEGAVLRGIGGVALHLGITFGIIRILRRVLSWELAWIIGAAFAFQYAGMEMVAWNHIHGYLLAILAFVWGVDAWLARRAVVAGILFACAALTYECTIGPLMLLVVLGGLKRDLRWVLMGALPVTLFLTLDAVDLLLHPMSVLADPFAARAVGAAQLFPLHVFDIFGMSAIAWTAPWAVDLTYAAPFDRAIWDFSRWPVVVYRSLGLVVCLLFTGAFLRSLRAVLRGEEGDEHLVVIAVGTLLWTVLAVFTWFRVLTRGFYSYLGVSTYYFYFTTLGFVVVSGSVAAPWLRRLPVVRARALVLVLAGLQILPGVLSIRRDLGGRVLALDIVKQTHLAIQAALVDGGCYAGSLDPTATRLHPPGAPGVLEGALSCANRNLPDRERWVLAEREDRYVLVPLRSPRWTEMAGPDVVREGLDGRRRFLAPDTVDPTGVRLVVDRIGEGGLLVALDSSELVFGFTDETWWIRDETPDGDHYLVEATSMFTPRHTAIPIELRRIDGRWWAFREGMVFAALEDVASLKGRVGWAHIANGPVPQRFVSLAVTTDDDGLDWSRAKTLDLPLLEAASAAR